MSCHLFWRWRCPWWSGIPRTSPSWPWRCFPQRSSSPDPPSGWSRRSCWCHGHWWSDPVRQEAGRSDFFFYWALVGAAACYVPAPFYLFQVLVGDHLDVGIVHLLVPGQGVVEVRPPANCSGSQSKTLNSTTNSSSSTLRGPDAFAWGRRVATPTQHHHRQQQTRLLELILFPAVAEVPSNCTFRT